jgi:hypothetical protein
MRSRNSVILRDETDGLRVAAQTRVVVRFAAVAAVVAAIACGPQVGPRIDPIAPRVAVVGSELEIVVRVHSGGAPSSLSFRSDLADLATRRLRPTLTPFAGGEWVFRWTPLAGDEGARTIDFVAVANAVEAVRRVAVEVRPGEESLRFRAPVGEGTTLDLSRERCAEVDVLVEDGNATEVAFTPGDPWAEGATLEPTGPLSATLRFCPVAEQLTSGGVFPLVFTASDEHGARAAKRYVIVVEETP